MSGDGVGIRVTHRARHGDVVGAWGGVELERAGSTGSGLVDHGAQGVLHHHRLADQWEARSISDCAGDGRQDNCRGRGRWQQRTWESHLSGSHGAAKRRGSCHRHPGMPIDIRELKAVGKLERSHSPRVCRCCWRRPVLGNVIDRRSWSAGQPDERFGRECGAVHVAHRDHRSSDWMGGSVVDADHQCVRRRKDESLGGEVS